MGDPMRVIEQRLERVRRRYGHCASSAGNSWGERSSDPRCILYAGPKSEVQLRRYTGANDRRARHLRGGGKPIMLPSVAASVNPLPAHSTPLRQWRPAVGMVILNPLLPPPEPIMMEPTLRDGRVVDQACWFAHPVTPPT